MGKMTSEALALHRPTGGSIVAPALALRPIGSQDRRAILTRAVEIQVIPHLLQRSARQDAGSQRAGSIGAHVTRLVELLLQASAQEVVDFVSGLLDEGLESDAILLELLTPAAQRLGQHWVDDVCTFADVTIGVGHLQTAVHALRLSFFGGIRLAVPGAPRALLLPLPGEQHSFGVSVLSAFFARAGWDVWSGAVTRGADLAAAVREDWIDLVGFSVSTDAMVEAARRQVAAVRAASRNPRLVVMVGGLPFARDPSLAEAIGADGTALDGAQAVEVATALLPTPLAAQLAAQLATS